MLKHLFSLDEGLHCLRLRTSVGTKETENDDLHTIEVLVRYNVGNITKFTWKGAKSDGSVNEICVPLHKTITGLLIVKDVWIKQHGSNKTWFAKSILLQENVEAPYYASYSLNPTESEFWTDGYFLFYIYIRVHRMKIFNLSSIQSCQISSQRR